MNLTESQIESMAPNPAAFSAGKKLSLKDQWNSFAKSDRALWGAIKGSGKSPYLAQIDTGAVAYKCTCPSRQFPCKHTIALMLLFVNHKNAFQSGEEPEWVKDWMDKREAKEQRKNEAPTERTEEEEEQLERNRGKTQVNRLASVMQGVAELELWLKDLVRIGLLALPGKPKAEFDKLAARMVDAKAPGLSGWVKAYGQLNYQNADEWQENALRITSRLFLLLRALKNYDSMSPLWQQTLRNLSGWSQSPKELLVDQQAESITDTWIVVGQETEINEEEITIQRNWLVGSASARTALILNFGTKFSALDNTLLPGSIIQAELVFFPSILPQRAVVRKQHHVLSTLEVIPGNFISWQHAFEYRSNQLAINPWANDFIIILENARMVSNGSFWSVCDQQKQGVSLDADYDFDKIMNWLALTGNRALPMAVIIRNSNVIPLGIIINNTYKLL